MRLLGQRQRIFLPMAIAVVRGSAFSRVSSLNSISHKTMTKRVRWYLCMQWVAFQYRKFELRESKSFITAFLLSQNETYFCTGQFDPGRRYYNSQGSKQIYPLLWRDTLYLLRLLLCKHPWTESEKKKIQSVPLLVKYEETWQTMEKHLPKSQCKT